MMATVDGPFPRRAIPVEPMRLARAADPAGGFSHGTSAGGGGKRADGGFGRGDGRPAARWLRERRGQRIQPRRLILQPPPLSRRCSSSGPPDDRGSAGGNCGSADGDNCNRGSHSDICSELPPLPSQLDDSNRRLGIGDL
ncbi:Os04g0344650 [Oryza sativa Japonica Group]|uniref:Os04g0344650 protein n=3 Tax=Oryza sativa TaxID=4530 RepID=A0A0N7KIV6_ORYSJ|nr:Os04g0344650 [Oryza sativa Japonica Group]